MPVTPNAANMFGITFFTPNPTCACTRAGTTHCYVSYCSCAPQGQCQGQTPRNGVDAGYLAQYPCFCRKGVVAVLAPVVAPVLSRYSGGSPQPTYVPSAERITELKRLGLREDSIWFRDRVMKEK